MDRHRKEYGDRCERIKWLTPGQVEAAEKKRADLLARLGGLVEYGFRGTKIDCRRLSPGCRLCGAGDWSCLFINSKCNCRCFYCPTVQDRVDVPTTQTVRFTRPGDYVDYIERFGYKGVSISGGEPLLTLDRTLAYLTAVKKKFGNDVHTWLYTNGVLANEDIFGRLRDSGLDEIRFDIGAVGYLLDKAAKAVGVIPAVTVEIPAIPEDFEFMTVKMREMADAGIDFLNLHQLRLTPHNFEHLIGRGYTFLSDEKVAVLESEWTALALMTYAFEHHIDLPVNYCSFVYKSRFQRAAARTHCAALVKKGYETISANGHLRGFCLTGDTDHLRMLVAALESGGASSGQWHLQAGSGRLYLHPDLLFRLDYMGFTPQIVYYDTGILPEITYMNMFHEIRLNPRMKVVIEKIRVLAETGLTVPEFDAFRRLINGSYGVCDPGALSRFAPYEFIPSGFQQYRAVIPETA